MLWVTWAIHWSCLICSLLVFDYLSDYLFLLQWSSSYAWLFIFCRLKINHDSHEFILEFGTITNKGLQVALSIAQYGHHVTCQLLNIGLSGSHLLFTMVFRLLICCSLWFSGSHLLFIMVFRMLIFCSLWSSGCSSVVHYCLHSAHLLFIIVFRLLIFCSLWSSGCSFVHYGLQAAHLLFIMVFRLLICCSLWSSGCSSVVHYGLQAAHLGIQFTRWLLIKPSGCFSVFIMFSDSWESLIMVSKWYLVPHLGILNVLDHRPNI